mgnify:CR=1 FL=1
MLEISLNMYHAVALGAFLFWLGGVITSKISLLNRYCIPAPLVGGLCFSIVNCILYSTGAASITFDDTLQSVFMIMFFTTVGFTVSIPALLKGGKAVLLCLLVAVVMIPVQNFLGGGVMALFGKDPLLGIGCGSIALVGGPGTAAAYGPELEAAGAVGGSVVSIAAATFGLISGVLVGGPLGRRLIVKYDLKPEEHQANYDDIKSVNAAGKEPLSALDVIKNVVVIIVCMALGTMVSGWVSKLIGMSFPNYVGAMFVAVIVRNLNDTFHFYKFSFPLVDGIGDVMLNLYLALALMTLKLWELASLMGGVLLIVICQVVFIVTVSYFVIFRILGKSYDAAVMCSGLCGHGLGATPTAIVNMTAVTERYGMSSRAFMVVPIVGAFLVDLIYQPQTIAFIKFFVPAASNLVG